MSDQPTLDPSVSTEGSMAVATKMLTENVTGVVLYSDGSSRPASAGFVGWGVHGYTYGSMDKGGELAPVLNCIYTDQGYVRRDQLSMKFDGMESKPVKPIQIVEMMASSSTQGTNNTAEINGAIKALMFAKEHGIKNLTIRLDSQYTRTGLVQWCRNWERNNWLTATGEPVKNRALWQTAYSLYKEMRASGYKIQVHWVQGHEDNLGNVQADALAGTAANMSMANVLVEKRTLEDPKSYWKSEVERHPMINCRRIYYNSQPSFNTPGCYFQADPGAADHYIGKRLAETAMSSIRLYEPEPIVESIKKRQYQTSEGVNTIIRLEMDKVYDRNIFPYLKEYGGHALTPNRSNLNLKWFNKSDVSVEVGATGLSMVALENFNLLESMLNKFLERKKGDFPRDETTNPLNVHDITPIFYDKKDVLVKKDTVVKYILKDEFVVGFSELSIYVQEPLEGVSQKLKIPLILGIDLLPRNNLKKLEPYSPKVYLITWREGRKSLRYATIVDCDKGIGIWSNFYADRIFFV